MTGPVTTSERITSRKGLRKTFGSRLSQLLEVSDLRQSAEFNMLFNFKKGLNKAGCAGVVSDRDQTLDLLIAVTRVVTSDSKMERPRLPGPRPSVLDKLVSVIF